MILYPFTSPHSSPLQCDLRGKTFISQEDSFHWNKKLRLWQETKFIRGSTLIKRIVSFTQTACNAGKTYSATFRCIARFDMHHLVRGISSRRHFAERRHGEAFSRWRPLSESFVICYSFRSSPFWIYPYGFRMIFSCARYFRHTPYIIQYSAICQQLYWFL